MLGRARLSMNNEIKILVLSDLHAIVKVDNSNIDDSLLVFKNGTSKFGSSFIEYAKRLELKIDILICSGDISNKANTEGFRQGWLFLNTVKKELNIPQILSVPGNHDHQSRETPGVFDPKHHLQFISPPFPFECNNKNTHFWGWHWCHSHIDDQPINAISLNSSAYHGYSDEFEHGRISTEACNQISKYIKSDSFEKRTFNLLLCHHHPEKMDYVDFDYDCEEMEGGSYLLRELDKAEKGPWLIIHGHKHFADIVYARSLSSCGPTIFSAGSMSAKLHEPIEDRASNQFYILNIDNNKTEEEERLIGTFQAHEWTTSDGWHPSKTNHLPSEGGFGDKTSPKKTAREIAKNISDKTPFLDIEDLKVFDEKLKYLTPLDLGQLIKSIEEGGLEVIVENNRICQIGRPAQ